MRISIVLISFFCLPLFSQNYIRIIQQDGEPFSLSIDDSLINTVQQTEVSFGPLDKDTLNLKCILSGGSELKTIVYLLDKKSETINKEFNYVLIGKKAPHQLKFVGIKDFKRIPEPIVPQKPKVDTSQKYKNTTLEHYVEIKNNKPIWFNNYPYDGKCQMAMPSNYMSYFHLLMKKAQNEDDRYYIAENTARNNCISILQLNQMLTYIPFEIEKLKFIRVAYFSLTDPEHKDKLDSTFKLESSKIEWQNFYKNINDYKYRSDMNCISASEDSIITNMAEKLRILSSDIERLTYFKKTYGRNCYSSKQSETILKIFVHDRERMEAAKLLYFHCSDKENFYYISDIFMYKLYSSELIDFISKQKK